MKTRCGKADVPGDAVDGQSRLPDLLNQQAPGCVAIRFVGTCPILLLPSSIVVVGQFHLERVSILPDKANPPSARDANTVLSIVIAPEPLKPVSRRHLKVPDVSRIVDPIPVRINRLHHVDPAY